MQIRLFAIPFNASNSGPRATFVKHINDGGNAVVAINRLDSFSFNGDDWLALPLDYIEELRQKYGK